jgi:mycothiol synthase
MAPLQSIIETCRVSLAPVRERRAWLGRLLDAPRQSAAECHSQVTAFAEYAREMALDIDRLWVSGGGLAGAGAGGRGSQAAAALCVPAAGRTALVMVPDGRVHRAAAGDLRAVLAHAAADVTLGEVRLFQCLPDDEDGWTIEVLASAGYESIATLIYMERDVSAEGLARDPLPAARAPRVVPGSAPAASDTMAAPAGRWVCFDRRVRHLFAETILASYEGSLDCPALAGRRTIDDILAGHFSAGRFAAHRWRLLEIGGRGAGCILLSEHPLQPVLELAYMGVSPAFRGRGVGGALISEALRLAHIEQFQRVTLAVDAGNAPALLLYRRAGFVETQRRRAMVRWSDSSSLSP